MSSLTPLPFTRPKHILSARQFGRPFLDYMYELINQIRKFDKTKDGLMYLQSLLNAFFTPVFMTILYFEMKRRRSEGP